MKGLPEGMSRVKKDHQPPSMRTLTILVAMAVFFGMAATAAAIISAQTTRGASQADIRATADLVEQVRMLEEIAQVNQAQHRQFNQADHDCIIALAILLSDPDRDRTQPVKPPCRAATLPSSAPSTIIVVPPETAPARPPSN